MFQHGVVFQSSKFIRNGWIFCKTFPPRTIFLFKRIPPFFSRVFAPKFSGNLANSMSTCLLFLFGCFSFKKLGVSKNRGGLPKWMVKIMENKPYENGMIWGGKKPPIFGLTPSWLLFGTFPGLYLGNMLDISRHWAVPESMIKKMLCAWKDAGTLCWSNYSDLTPNGGLVREVPLFQGNLGW